MALLGQFSRKLCTAGLSLAVVGCSSLSKNPLAIKSNQPTATAVSGSGDFASNKGPKDPAKIHLAYGQWQEQMGQQAEAREFYAKVLAEQPKNLDALLGIARIDQAAGLLDDAEARLKQAQKIAPKDARVYATYGAFHTARNDWPKAIEAHRAAVKAAPDDQRYQYLLGVALAKSGDIDASYPYFARSVGDAEAHYNIGLILNQTGDVAGCQERLEQALALKPDLTAAQTLLERLQQEADQPVYAGGSQRIKPAATPASGVRAVPLKSQTLSNTLKKPGSSGSPLQPPAGLTPAQQEQWRNQQAQ